MHEALFAFENLPNETTLKPFAFHMLPETSPHRTDAAYLEGDRTYALTPV
jgi:hypothetical protein